MTLIHETAIYHEKYVLSLLVNRQCFRVY